MSGKARNDVRSDFRRAAGLVASATYLALHKTLYDSRVTHISNAVTVPMGFISISGADTGNDVLKTNIHLLKARDAKMRTKIRK
jgi:hypothetical protein